MSNGKNERANEIEICAHFRMCVCLNCAHVYVSCTSSNVNEITQGIVRKSSKHDRNE